MSETTTQRITAERFAKASQAVYLACEASVADDLSAMLRQAAATERALQQTRTLALEAVNGWACYAKRKIEHDDISRIHAALRLLAEVPHV